MTVVGKILIHLKAWNVHVNGSYAFLSDINMCKDSRVVYSEIMEKFCENLNQKLNAVSSRYGEDFHLWSFTISPNLCNLTVSLTTTDEDLTVSKFKDLFDAKVLPILKEKSIGRFSTVFIPDYVMYSSITIGPVNTNFYEKEGDG